MRSTSSARVPAPNRGNRLQVRPCTIRFALVLFFVASGARATPRLSLSIAGGVTAPLGKQNRAGVQAAIGPWISPMNQFHVGLEGLFSNEGTFSGNAWAAELGTELDILRREHAPRLYLKVAPGVRWIRGHGVFSRSDTAPGLFAGFGIGSSLGERSPVQL